MIDHLQQFKVYHDILTQQEAGYHILFECDGMHFTRTKEELEQICKMHFDQMTGPDQAEAVVFKLTHTVEEPAYQQLMRQLRCC